MTTSFFEAHNYPLTSVPLPLASLDWDLRQGSKASLRIYLIFRSSALLSVLIVDGMSDKKYVITTYMGRVMSSIY